LKEAGKCPVKSAARPSLKNGPERRYLTDGFIAIFLIAGCARADWADAAFGNKNDRNGGVTGLVRPGQAGSAQQGRNFPIRRNAVNRTMPGH
jgi:hypothetical protein